MAGIADAFSNAMYSPQDTGWGIAASGAIGALPGLYNPHASTSKNFWVTAGGGIVAALLAGMARNQADKENANLYGSFLQGRGKDEATQKALIAESPRLAGLFARDLDADFQRKQELANYEAMTPLITARAGETKKAELKAENEAYSGVGGIGTGATSVLAVPKEFRKTAIDEQEKVLNIEKSKAFANKMFEASKQLTGPKAALTMNLGIPTTEGDQLQGIIDSTILQIDTALGKEINSDLRNRLVSLFPRSTDSNEAIDNKKQRFNEILDSVSKSTPVLNMFGVNKSGAALLGGGGGFEVGGTYQGKKILSVKRIS